MFALPRLLLPLSIAFFVNGCGSSSTKASQEMAAAPVFNVPSLFGKNIDQVASTLGQAEWDSVAPGTSESTRLFRRDAVLLRVGYGARTRKVHSFLIESTPNKTADLRSLLRLVNLTGDEPVLVVVPVFSKTHSGGYSGVKVFLKDDAELTN